MGKLTSADLAEIEDRLRAMRIALLAAVREHLPANERGQLPGLGSLQSAAHGDEQGRADGALRDIGISISIGIDSDIDIDSLTQDEIIMLRRQLKELRAVDDALKRIEFGVGGLCTQCGMQIPLAHLRAAPAAATCLACAALVQQ